MAVNKSKQQNKTNVGKDMEKLGSLCFTSRSPTAGSQSEDKSPLLFSPAHHIQNHIQKIKDKILKEDRGGEKTLPI